MKGWLLFFFLIGMGMSTSLQAQDAYDRAAGIRLGPLTGVSYKHFVTFAGTVEGIFGYNFTNGRTVSLTGLFEQHFFLTYQLNAFAGGGITLAGNSDTFRFHLEVIAGVEYTFPRFPLNFSVDYKPAYLVNGNELIFNEFALSIRYIL